MSKALVCLKSKHRSSRHPVVKLKASQMSVLCQSMSVIGVCAVGREGGVFQSYCGSLETNMAKGTVERGMVPEVGGGGLPWKWSVAVGRRLPAESK